MELCSYGLFYYDYITIAKLIFIMSVFAMFSNIFYEANKQLFVRAFVCAFYVAYQQQKKLIFSL